MSFQSARPEWMNQGECRGYPPEMFYPVKVDSSADYKAAKTVCDGCPIKDECLEYGIENRELGMWGGTTEKERRAIRQRRSRQRNKLARAS